MENSGISIFSQKRILSYFCGENRPILLDKLPVFCLVSSNKQFPEFEKNTTYGMPERGVISSTLWFCEKNLFPSTSFDKISAVSWIY
jgi:hypothetical protein